MSKLSNRRQSAAAAAGALCCVAFSCCAIARADEDPRQVLAEHGLANLGDAWLCPAEVEARRWFDALDPLERQLQILQRAVDDRIKANEKAKAELSQKRRELKAVLEKIAANDPAALGPTRDQLKQSAKELEEQVKRLRQIAKDGTRLAEFQPAREEVIRLANARAGLTLAAGALRRRAAEAPQQYEQLGKNADVRRALAKLPQHRLGTGKNYAADAAERLARIDKATQSNVVPVYRDDAHTRVLAIVDEKSPVTFSLRHSNGPTHLPHSVVTSLNLSIADAPQVSYSVGGRKLACRRIVLESVQIGGVVLKDVETLALPPEGEDLGAKLGRAAYPSHYFDVDYSLLRLTILDGTAKDEKEDASKSNGKSPGEPANGSSKSVARPRPTSPSTVPLPLPMRSGRTPGGPR